ncbi:hypothetical protein GVAV_001518 [Gurleya vavrai]
MNQLTKILKNLTKKKITYIANMQNKNLSREYELEFKNFSVKNKNKNLVEKISFNSYITHLDKIKSMHNAIEE